MQKLTIELDLDKPDDLQLLQVISRFKAEQAQGKHPDLKGVVARTVVSDNNFPSTTPLHESHKEMARVSADLGKQIGTKTTMSNKERASIAAKARWAQKRAREEGEPIPEPPKKKSNPKRDDSFADAQEQSLAEFPTQNAQDFVLSQMTRPAYPDGRELIEGTWKSSTDGEHDAEVPLDVEDELEEARRIAREYAAE